MLFRSYRKRKALESYQTVLGERLRGTYDLREHYEPHEVMATARFYGLSETYLCHALAIYCTRAAFDAYHAERGDAACSCNRLRPESTANVFVSDGSMNLSAMMDATANGDAFDFGDVCDVSFAFGIDFSCD